MSFYVSEKKPDVPKKPEVKLEYNNRSYESYIHTGFPNIIPQTIRGPNNRMQKFLNLVDLRKGPIERTVRCMVRLKAVDWNTKKHERKEYIYYEERWEAKDWLGHPILNPIDGHIEGKYTEVLTRPVFDKVTGDHTDNEFAGTREVSYSIFKEKRGRNY
jgi:hypothetical protein